MRHIALLRGVNVGGTGTLPMVDFRDMLTAMGFSGVRTYIQSGNAVFDSEAPPEMIGAKIAGAIEARFGFRRPVIMRSVDDFRAVVTDDPHAATPLATRHVFFCSEDQTAVETRLISALAANGETWAICGSTFYLHAPAGIGKSKLAERLPKLLAGDVTARNMKTVRAIFDLALTNP